MNALASPPATTGCHHSAAMDTILPNLVSELLLCWKQKRPKGSQAEGRLDLVIERIEKLQVSSVEGLRAKALAFAAASHEPINLHALKAKLDAADEALMWSHIKFLITRTSARPNKNALLSLISAFAAVNDSCSLPDRARQI